MPVVKSGKDMTRDSLKLYESLAEGRGVQRIVETAENILNNPVLIADSSFRVIAHAEKPDVNDKLWNQIIEQGFYPADYVCSITNDIERYQRINKADSVEILTDKVSPYRYITKMITVSGKPIGFATCIEYETTLTKQDLEIFSVFCKVVGLELKDSDLLKHGYGKWYEYFILDMITGSLNIEYLDERIRALDLKFRNKNFIFVLEFVDKRMGHEHEIDYFCRSLNQIIPKSNCVAYRKSLVTLISQDKPDTPAALFAKPLAEFLKASNMIGGLSRCFHNTCDMRMAYMQACHAINIGRRLEGGYGIYDYNQMSFYHILELLHDKGKGNLRQFCNPKLLDIMEYDTNYNTRFAYTAYIFIRNDRNPVNTSHSLSIHRNTVDYRIKRISELFNIDLNKQETIFSFDLSFHILEYLHELPYSGAPIVRMENTDEP